MVEIIRKAFYSLFKSESISTIKKTTLVIAVIMKYKDSRTEYLICNSITLVIISTFAKRNKSHRRRIMLPEQVSVWESEGCWKMVGDRRGGWVKQDTCVWSHLSDFIFQCYLGLLFKKCSIQNDSTFL